MSSSLKLIPKEQETDQEVTWEDQQKINVFSRLNVTFQDMEELYKEKKLEKEYLDDLSTELELADEDELVKYKIGDAFVSLPLAECNERLESEQKAINKELEDLKDSLENSSQQMDQLKTALYAKFGKAINLER